MKAYFSVSMSLGRDPRVVRALRDGGDVALTLWLLALGWAREELTDGHVPADMLEALHPLRLTPDALSAAAAALVSAGLWREADGGYQIAGFSDWNPSRAEIEEKRAKDRERKSGRAAPRIVPENFHVDSRRIPDGFQTDSARTPDGIHSDSARIPQDSTRKERGREKGISTLHSAGAPERAQASSAPEPSRVPADPLAAELLAKLEATLPLRPIAAAHHAETLAGRCHGRGTKAPAALAALDDLARDAQAAADAGSPWGREYLAAKAAKYIDHARAPSSVRADASRPYQRPPPSPVQQGCDLPAGTLEELLALTEREVSHGAR